MARKLSRLNRVKRKRESRQAVFYLALAIGLIVVILIWGIPVFAKFAGLFMDKNDFTFVESDSEFKPTPPILYDVPESTPSARIYIEGVSDAGMEVILFQDNSEVEKVVVDESGDFVFRDIKLTEGENLIYAIARNPKGLESDKSKLYTVVLDTVSPEVSITEPEDGTVFRGESERTVTITGEVDEDARSVYVGDRIAIVTTEGTFSVKYMLEEGDQDLVVKAIDEAGNESKVSITLRWEK